MKIIIISLFLILINAICYDGKYCSLIDCNSYNPEARCNPELLYAKCPNGCIRPNGKCANKDSLNYVWYDGFQYDIKS